jgi:hypothetical protein
MSYLLQESERGTKGDDNTMTEEEEAEAALEELQQTKVLISKTKRILVFSLLLSFAIFCLSFFFSYVITIKEGFGFMSGLFIGCGLSGVYFIVKTLLHLQDVFEREQEAKDLERRIQKCLTQLEEKKTDGKMQ